MIRLPINFVFSIFLISLFLTTTNYSQSDPVLFDNAYYEFNAGKYNDARYPVDSRIADLDNDGDMDVVVSKYGFSSGFAVLFNDGKGFFGDPVQYTSNEDTEGIEIGDFNNDNFTDVVVANTGFNWEGNTISVFFNDGNGGFNLSSHYSVGDAPTGITADDFDNDNDVDLAVTNYGYLGQGSSISILTNNGDGTFASAVNFTAGDGPYRVESELINNDNLVDLVIANEEQKVNVLINSGGNDFSNRTELDAEGNWAGNFYFNVNLSDMDNDDDYDILYSSTRTWNGDRGQIAYFKNNGDGTFASPTRIDLVNFTAGAVDVGTADLNEDGWLDIVGASFSGRTSDGYQVVLSDGAGGFLPAFKNPAGQATRDIMLADVDNDNIIDVVTTDNYTLGVTVHINQGNAEFVTPSLYPTTYSAGYLEAADIDLDGDLDVATSATIYTAVGVHVAVLLNNGDGSFDDYNTDYSVRSGGVQVKFRDLNGDQYPDLLFATSRTSPPYDFHFAINNGDGTFGTTQTVSLGSCGWADIDAFDIDNDGDLDVIVNEWLGCPGVPESGRRMYINLNNGDATFQSPIIRLVNPHPAHLEGADLDEDGNVDLVTGQSGSIDIHFGNGDATFQDPVTLSLSATPRGIVIDDLNADGNLDIATCNWDEQGFMNVLMGNGDGTFQSPQEYYLAYSPDLSNASGITTGDVNQDGHKDIIVGNNASNTVSVYLNTGSGSFIYKMRYGIYYSPNSPVFGDFDEDEINDVGVVVGLPPSGLPGAVTYLKGRDIGVVPVELSSFSANLLEDKIKLTWLTATETNNSHFEVERSFDNRNFETIGTVEGNGTTAQQNYYSFEDKNIESGKRYYRLRQVDLDGSFSYSKTIAVDPGTELDYKLAQNYPNPFNPETTIEYTIPEKGNVQLTIYNSLGEKVTTLVNETKEKGSYSVNFDADNLASGIYIYRMKINDFVSSKKLILMK